MQRRRKWRRPVLSRLTWAWLCVCVVFVIAAGVIFHFSRSDGGAHRIALPVDAVERLARAPAVAGGEERIAPPPQPMADQTEGGDAMAEDGLTLIYPPEGDLFAESDDLYTDDETAFSVEDVVITIAGGSRPNPVTAASLTPGVQPIPDPDSALLRSTPLGQTPRIAPDGRRAVSHYAHPFAGAPGKGRIAIVVGGLGLNAAVTERAIDTLPPEVSLSFAPYAKNLDFWTRKARQAGHEVLIELPMETYGANVEALGAAALLTSRSEQENLQRLTWLMARFGGYVAATNYLGAKFSADPEAISPVLSALREAGVGYVDDTGAAARAPGAAGLPIASVSRIIPAAAHESDVRGVRRELAALEQIALKDGAALGKTYAYAATIDELAVWFNTLPEKDLAAAPASALLRTAAADR